MPSLVLESKSRSYGVYKAITTIGSGSGLDVRIEEPGVRDLHARINFDGRDFIIYAEEGEIRVNGKKRKKSKIYHQDRIQLGTETFLSFSVFDESIEQHFQAKGHTAVGKDLAGMTRLAEFSRRLLDISSPRDQLEALLDTTIEATGAEKGFVVLVGEKENQIAAARNVSRDDLPKDIAQLSDSILEKAIAARHPIMVSGENNKTLFHSSASILDLDLSSALCAPLYAQEELLGILYLGSESASSGIDKASVDLISIFASQGALLLHHALMVDGLRSERDELIDRRNAGESPIIGSSAAVLQVLDTIARVSKADVPVLITGETGTGKELFAHEVHRLSDRNKGPFVVVNCGAIPENLIESELFGHVKGAFTGAVETRGGKFQQAHQGTLFLDELGELPLGLQVKLLRALQEHRVTKVGSAEEEPINIRVVAATNRSIEKDVEEGRFREDLYYRLNVVRLHLPPLRERGDDIVQLAQVFLQRFSSDLGANVRGFTPAAMEELKKYSWPGNIRQLENVVKKALIMAPGTMVGKEMLALPDSEEGSLSFQTLAEAKEEFVRGHILAALERHGGNRTKAARELDIDPRTVFRYLERSVQE